MRRCAHPYHLCDLCSGSSRIAKSVYGPIDSEKNEPYIKEVSASTWTKLSIAISLPSQSNPDRRCLHCGRQKPFQEYTSPSTCTDFHRLPLGTRSGASWDLRTNPSAFNPASPSLASYLFPRQSSFPQCTSPQSTWVRHRSPSIWGWDVHHNSVQERPEVLLGQLQTPEVCRIRLEGILPSHLRGS